MLQPKNPTAKISQDPEVHDTHDEAAEGAEREARRASITPGQKTTPGGSALPLAEAENAGGTLACRETAHRVRAICAITIDGGTKFHTKRKSLSPCEDFERIMAMLQDSNTPDAGIVALPMPQLDVFKRPPKAEFTVSGTKRHILTFHVRDIIWFQVNADMRTISLQLKAKGMWAAGGGAQGYASMIRRWLPAVHFMLTGDHISLEDSHAQGWNMTGLELCSDFTGLEFKRSDSGNFLQARVQGEKLTGKGRRSKKTKGGYLGVYGSTGELAETIELGQRTSSQLSVCIYNKSQQIKSQKQGDFSTYAPHWTAHGWDGEEKITRVEFRFRNKGLSFTDKTTGEVLDFRDPMTATKYKNLQAIWAVTAHKRRLIIPDSATRPSRAKTDSRWESVQEASQLDLNFGEDWKQSREVQAGTHEFRKKKAARDMIKSEIRFASLCKIDVAELASWSVRRDLHKYAGEHTRDVDRTQYQSDYIDGRCGFILEEIDAERERFDDFAPECATIYSGPGLQHREFQRLSVSRRAGT